MNRPTTSIYPHPAVLLSMILSLFYWSYLGLTSQTMIYHDSLSYESIGRMLSQNNWKEYFITGPNREPLYPLFVSLAMHTANALGCDYLKIVAIFQIGILLLTQWMSAVTLKKLRVSVGLSGLVIAYIGFSPTLVNSGFILYSEILTYPMILWLLLQMARTWTEIKTSSYMSIVIQGILLGLAALAITFTKGIFEVIAPFLLTPFLISLFSKRTDSSMRKRISILLFIFTLIFYVPLSGYKQINKIYNGTYALTDRGTFVLYGETARRMLPVDDKLLKAAFVFIPGSDVCHYFYKDACFRWGTSAVNPLVTKKNHELKQHLPTRQQQNNALILESFKEIFRNPLQYAFLTVLEGTKIFFWEAQETYCVVYPDAISRIYDHPWLRYPLRFLLALASLLALLYGMIKIYKGWNNIFRSENGPDEKTSLEFYLVFMVVVYTSLAAIFYITARYTQPIIPLFLMLIAWQSERIIQKQKRQ